VLASHCSSSTLEVFQCALDLLRTGLFCGRRSPSAAGERAPPAPLPVGATRSLMILETLRYCYAAINNHGEEQFVVALVGPGGAECTRSVSLWTTPFRGGGADDGSALCALMRHVLCALPARNRTVYDYQLQCMQLLMEMPLPLVLQCGGVDGVRALLHVLRVQLQAVWDLDTDAGVVPREYIAGEKVDQHVAAQLVMGYHSEKATVMLMPVFVSLVCGG
jgi:hypothetical protein